MKILLSWLKDYVQFDQSAEKLAEDLSMFAHEVEAITKVGDDAILDLEITPNRGDCLSHLGIARQVAAMYDLSLNIPKVTIQESDLDQKLNITIEKENICPRYTARIIDNIEIKPSPKWLQDRLIAYGFRPINNVVDITNYIMIAQGQPLHAFDYDKINQGVMNIRLSQKGETMVTLDDKERVLPEAAIVIDDGQKVFDLSGIMGGATSEISNQTKTIILQGAIFDPVLVRRASKYLHHQTDASYRYERGVDFEGTVDGVDLATDLILQTSPKAKIGELIDQKQVQSIKQTVPFSFDKINRLINTNLDQMTINSYLQRLYFKVDGDIVTVPSFRVYDVSIWQDLAEEVARVYGFSQIERIIPQKLDSISVQKEWQVRESVKDFLKEKGFTEVYATSFANEDMIKILGYDLLKCEQIINPIAPETKYLRSDLSLSLLLAVGKNPWSPEVNIFEIEKVFFDGREFWQLGIVTVGKNESKLLEIKNLLSIKNEIIKIEQDILDVYKIRRPVFLITSNISDVKSLGYDIDYNVSQSKLRPISKFAPTVRDISIVLDSNISSDEIQKEILGVSSAILFSDKFDEFTSPKFGQNKKSLAFHIWLQDLDKTVSEESANQIIQRIIERLELKFKAKLRS